MNERTLALYATFGLGLSTVIADGAAMAKNPGFWTGLALLSGIGCIWIIWEYIWNTVEAETRDEEDTPDDVR